MAMREKQILARAIYGIFPKIEAYLTLINGWLPIILSSDSSNPCQDPVFPLKCLFVF